MREIKLLFVAIALMLLTVSCNTEKEKNRKGIWLWGTHMKEAPIQEYAQKGYGHILLNEAAFKKWSEEEVFTFIKDCEDLGITVHIWFQCFFADGKWVSPIDDEKKAIKQDFYDEVIARAVSYVEKGIKGIHLDYIRYGGTAHKHDFPECRATYSITEFCRQINIALKAINPDIILSAAMMPEIDSEYYYGQNPTEMGQYIDILMPMVYKYGYAGKDKSVEWVIEVSNWFVEKGAPAEVWVGIQTYSVNLEDEGVIPLTEEQLLSDCKDVANTNATGLVLFRHGLGEFPDVNELWNTPE